jgi:hypothetical protein
VPIGFQRELFSGLADFAVRSAKSWRKIRYVGGFSRSPHHPDYSGVHHVSGEKNAQVDAGNKTGMTKRIVLPNG